VNEQNWRKLYEATISEGDQAKLNDRIRETEAAIFLRVQTLASSPDFWGERRDIQNASTALLRLKLEKLHFPGWQSHH